MNNAKNVGAEGSPNPLALAVALVRRKRSIL